MLGRVAQYRLLASRGPGPIAETYAAYDEHLARAVVLKIIDRERLADEGARRTFVTAARAAAALSHPAICRVYDVIEIDRRAVIVMEDVAGQTVRERTAGGATFAPREVVWHGRAIAEALSALHAHGILHRDLSADSVMITLDGKVKLLDVGLTHFVTLADPAAGAAAAAAPSRGMLAGAPVYLAPELLTGGPASTRSDLYAAGVLLYLMATGRLPFAEHLSQTTLSEMLVHTPVPPGLLVAGLPGSLERAIMRLLEKSPEARFPSADSLAAAL